MKKIKGGKKMDSKGISPLIGTVLLIGFTIGLAMLIFTWGGRFVGEVTEETGATATEQLDCIRNVDLGVSGATHILDPLNPGVAKSVEYTVTNNGQVGITEFKARFTDTSGATSVETEKRYAIAAFGSQKITSVFTSVIQINKVEVLSPVTDDGIVCQDIKESAGVSAS